METRFEDTARQYAGALLPFRPFPAAPDRRSYEALPEALRKNILEEGERFLGYAYPAIRATDFMKFKRTGNRTDYESLYFARRHALNALAAGECTELKGRFLDDIINGIFTLCEESAWQLPPHNSYLRDTPQLLLPDASHPVMDLFACETGAQIACVSYLLGEALDEISPLIRKRIGEELARRIVNPYLQEHFWWMGSGEEPMCNWTVWCTQNVLLTLFLGDFDEDTRRRGLLKAAASCDFFLKDYGEDGCCDEGAQYYRHAGLSLFCAMEIMNTVTDGAFQGLFDWDKIKNIASYIQNVHVAGKYYFNFSDCSPVAGRAGVLEYLFGKCTGQPELMRFGAEDFRSGGGPLYSDEVNRLNLYHRMQNIFHYEEVMKYAGQAPGTPSDRFYPSVGLFLARSPRLALAVKAGCNADNHNHNDTGSLTLYKDGLPLLVDIGVESYTEKTFSSRRYEIWTMQSGYHNLPTLMGQDQRDGADFRATEVNHSFGADAASISMELAAAYPPEEFSRLSYRRSVTLHRERNMVTLQDVTNCPDVILNFITCEKPLLLKRPGVNNIFQTFPTEEREAPGTLSTGEWTAVLQIGSLARMSFRGAEPFALETLPITDPRLQTAWDHDLYRIRLRMTGEEFAMEII